MLTFIVLALLAIQGIPAYAADATSINRRPQDAINVAAQVQAGDLAKREIISPEKKDAVKEEIAAQLRDFVTQKKEKTEIKEIIAHAKLIAKMIALETALDKFKDKLGAEQIEEVDDTITKIITRLDSSRTVYKKTLKLLKEKTSQPSVTILSEIPEDDSPSPEERTSWQTSPQTLIQTKDIFMPAHEAIQNAGDVSHNPSEHDGPSSPAREEKITPLAREQKSWSLESKVALGAGIGSLGIIGLILYIYRDTKTDAIQNASMRSIVKTIRSVIST